MSRNGLAAVAAVAVALSPARAGDFLRVRPGPEAPLDRRPRRGQREVLHRRGVFVDMVADAALRAELEARGYQIEVLQADLTGAIEAFRGPDAGGYRRHEGVVETVRGWRKARPDLVRVRVIGHGAEADPRGERRQLLAARFSLGAGPKPRILLFGGIHAREIATTEIPLQVGDRLVRVAGSEAGDAEDPAWTDLLRRREVWLLPELNPDGREYVFSAAPWWRKNRTPQRGGRIGVDLNRNFSFRWGPNLPRGGSSGNPGSGIYRGPEPFSEPETRALRRLARSVPFDVSLALHSYGEMILTPYGYDQRPVEHPALFERMRRVLVEATGYRDGSVPEVLGYYSNGRHDDWLYSGDEGEKGRTAAIELEVGRSFFPRIEAVPELTDQVSAGLVALAELAGPAPALRASSRRDPDGAVELAVAVRNLGRADARGVRLTVEVTDPAAAASERAVRPLRGLGQAGRRAADEALVRVRLGREARRVTLRLTCPGARPVLAEHEVEAPAD